MTRRNIFFGKGIYAQFALIIYRRLMSRKWVTYAEVMAEYDPKGFGQSGVSNSEGYGELKKAFPDVCAIIRERVGQNSIEVYGNNRTRKIRYVGEDPDPLADMMNARVVDDLKQYWKFCQDSAGFFPTSWLEYYFHDCQDLLDINDKRKKGELVLCADDRMQDNIDLLPQMYEAIVRHQVLAIDYKPFEEDLQQLIFHPHYLKEFNGRWFLFGYAGEEEPNVEFKNLALDRFQGKPREIYNKVYIPRKSDEKSFEDYFKDIVGVSHMEGQTLREIRVRAHSLYFFRLVETKKLHRSQRIIVPFGKHDDGEYGEFSLQIEANKEFMGRILQMGAGLEVISPEEVRKLFAESVRAMSALYNK